MRREDEHKDEIKQSASEEEEKRPKQGQVPDNKRKMARRKNRPEAASSVSWETERRRKGAGGEGEKLMGERLQTRLGERGERGREGEEYGVKALSVSALRRRDGGRRRKHSRAGAGGGDMAPDQTSFSEFTRCHEVAKA
ncbi:Hypothetical predicted protein [Xyrichtys novacula]|uniref:Uncharacterized protein n=1 Tax=Xyrichtys novacula TaxID=13765 RepID=A0AAV1F063_XYRNO|nr:Hypothetical predicted protein [Xyrichtys novacula]